MNIVRHTSSVTNALIGRVMQYRKCHIRPLWYRFSVLSVTIANLRPRHYITLHYITLQYITLNYITLHYIYITLHYITLHYITLHYITLHYITSFHTPITPIETNGVSTKSFKFSECELKKVSFQQFFESISVCEFLEIGRKRILCLRSGERETPLAEL